MYVQCSEGTGYLQKSFTDVMLGCIILWFIVIINKIVSPYVVSYYIVTVCTSVYMFIITM